MRGKEQSFEKTAIDLEKLTSQLRNPPQFHIECPSSDDRPSDAEPPAMVFWQKQIDAGLRFPICPFLSDLSQHGLADTSRLFHICHGVKVIGEFYCFKTKSESPAHFYGQIPGVCSGWLRKYFFVRPLSGHGWPFREVWWHVKLREIHTPSVDNLSKHEWSVLAAINASFDEKYLCLLRVVTDENALIYHGLFVNHNWSVDMAMSWQKILADKRRRAHAELQPLPSLAKDLEVVDLSNEPSPSPRAPELMLGEDTSPSAIRVERQSERKKAVSGQKRSLVISVERESSAHQGKRPSHLHPVALNKPFNSIFPGHALRLSDAQCTAFWETVPRDEDLAELRKLPSSKLKDMVSGNRMKTTVASEVLYERAEEYKSLKDEIKELKSRLEQQNQCILSKDKDLVSTATALHMAGAEITALSTTLEKERADHMEELERVRIQAYSQGREEGKVIGRGVGIKLCRRHILMTPIGQAFLKTLHEKMIEVYLRTPAFMIRMGDAISHFVVEGAKGACGLLGVSEKFKDLDVDSIIERISPSADLPIDEQQEQNYWWWMPVMKEAARVLAYERTDHPELPSVGQIEYPVMAYDACMVDLFAGTNADDEEAELWRV
ncbi:hypothetical protein SASPL_110192 [Salvia splendens]|uniref:Uncharacterized protein n=2 Tax=Salvia splendens TaxID=180675 RepID=A0A8X8Y795_SALSN|nr:hypothetical protein SASPL_110192 [Salvia splendens]